MEAYCKKHDEHEPQDHEETWWTCPKCSKESIYGGKTTLKIVDQMMKDLEDRRC